MTLGVLGGGQLGRMLALAGHPLGLSFTFIDPSPEAPMSAVARAITAAFDDPEALRRFASSATLGTWEFENIPIQTVRSLTRDIEIYPPLAALEVKRDRHTEKSFFRELGIPVAPFAPAGSSEELEAALQSIGFPCVVKTRRHGYDGKGQAVLDTPRDAGAVWDLLGREPLIVERKIPFDRELSIVAVRGRGGPGVPAEELFYPLIENRHEAGILRTSRAPAVASPELTATSRDMALRILRKLDYVGTLALELFQVGDQLLANEMAPRVHNSGHWTIEGADTSQFENHLRAGLGWRLGSTGPVGESLMVNLIGTLPDREAVLACPGAHLHLYGKEAKPGRKLGHVTIHGRSRDEVERSAIELGRILDPQGC
jgi:5-(carboxyamino)imidazole ribonucleotide synthase